LTLSIIFLVLLAIFIYHLGNTHQANCDYYYLHTTKLLYPFVVAVPTLLSIYTLVKLRQTKAPNPSDGQYFITILGVGAIIIAATFLYAILGFGLFFGKLANT
jgi:hypothetical protein